MSSVRKMSSRRNTPANIPLCPLVFALKKLSGRWTLVILRELMERPLRFNQLKRRLPLIPGKSLTRLLRRLELEGLVQRLVEPGEPHIVSYSAAHPDATLRRFIESATAWGRENYLRRSAEQWRSLIVDLENEPGIPVRPLILESWKRSRAAGLDPAPAELRFHEVSRRELRHRLTRNEHLLDVAEPLLSAAFARLNVKLHGISLADKDGIILYSTGDESTLKAWGLMPGCDWSETMMGTNGAGTALVAKQPLAVAGTEHYVLALHATTSHGAPVRSPEGDVIAVVDMRCASVDANPKLLERAVEFAEKIEAKLTITSANKRG